MNAAVKQGSAVTFQCSSDVRDSVLPWYNSLCVVSGTVDECREDLFYGGHLSSRIYPPRSLRFSVTAVNNGTHVTRDLNINPTQLTDAGVYLCAERRGGVTDIFDSKSALLIVLGKCN